MKKYLIFVTFLLLNIAFGQDKSIKTYDLNGVKFSVNKDYWLKIDALKSMPRNQFMIIEMRKLDYPYNDHIEFSSIFYTRAFESNELVKSGHQINKGSYLFRVILAVKNDDGGSELYKVIKLNERLVAL
jgi:hypothetical protein